MKIRVEDINMDDDSNSLNGGHVWEFTSDFDCEGGRSEKGRDWDGTIRIHNVFIETDPN